MSSSGSDQESTQVYDRCLGLIDQMLEATDRIIRRGQHINAPHEFTQSEESIDAMDGIILMIIVLGETTKKLERALPNSILLSHPSIDWKGLKGMRDILSHEYFGVDPAILLDVTKHKVPELKNVLLAIKAELERTVTSDQIPT